MDPSDRDRAAFGHIVESVEAILEYAARGLDRFLGDRMVQDAVVRRFEVVGEAAKRVSAKFRSSHPEVPWSELAGFRDYLIHGYDQVRPSRVWEIIEGPLKQVRVDLQSAKKSLNW